LAVRSFPINQGGVRSSRRKRSARTDIDHVHIDETFTLVGNDGEAVGNGHYISTELNNKRYYGVLISQDSLKNANDLHFQDEGFSLDLNRRMEALRTRHGAKDSEDKSKEDKRREFGNGKQVQKFQYVDATKKTLGYRVILATFANVLEASGDNADMLKSIKCACDEGGNWVDKYYYQYEVRCTCSQHKTSWVCRCLLTLANALVLFVLLYRIRYNPKH